MRNKIANIVVGAVLVALGVIFAGNVLGFWNVSIFFNGWWTLFIIIPCAVSMVTDGPGIANAIGTLVGVALLLAQQDIIGFDIIFKLIFPVVLIIVGLFVIFGSRVTKKIKELRSQVNIDAKSFTAIFAGHKAFWPAGEVFEGAECTAIFGGITLDLRSAKIEKDAIIEVSAVFGGIDIILPPTVKCVTHSTPIFGGMGNKRFYQDNGENTPTVYVNGMCAFGGVEIK